MRPPELDVTFVLTQLECFVTEDARSDGDEPYLWHLGFKVDAETLGPPLPGSIVPSLGVEVFEGGPHLRHLAGAGHVKTGETVGIAPFLGTRAMRLKPAFFPTVGWFPGFAGVLCLLWDEDGFAPATAEAAFARFKALFGPALAAELNRLVTSDAYDDDLAKDAAGITQPDPPEGRTLQWRFARLSDSGSRRQVVQAITANAREAVVGPVRDAAIDAAGWDELIDPDDLLGATAEVYAGNELHGTQPLSLTFTGDGARYEARGFVTASPVHRVVLDSVVLRHERREDRAMGLWRQVCWGPTTLYWAVAFRARTTIRYELRAVLGETPAVVRWFIDGTALPDGDSTHTVAFAPTSAHFGSPQNALAPFFAGGPSPILCRAAGPVLEVSNEGGDGVFLGQVKALYAYAGDPSLFPPPATPLAEVLSLGYERAAELDLVAVSLEMNADYGRAVGECARRLGGLGLDQVSPDISKEAIVPGDRPNWRRLLVSGYEIDVRRADVTGMDAPSVSAPTLSRVSRRSLAPR
ncbi:MAG: hypothetical protein ABW221_21660 [Vicinamibacteria bacterium]